MRSLITGAAGFIGSHLAESLLARGDEVLGVDCLTDYYDPTQKRANLAGLRGAFTFSEADLRTADLDRLLDGVDVVFHQAGQPGVRASWADGFSAYLDANVMVTQRLLEAARRAGVRRFVYASSSSVYGNRPTYPTDEETRPQPHSPYGVTKLAGEHLCSLYGANFGLPTVALRYFTVYGPRQRPDMAMHRLIEAAIHGTPFPLYGDGGAVRDFTFVEDVVAANLLAATAEVEPGRVFNVCAGGSTVMNDVIAIIEELLGKPVLLDRHPAAKGDVDRTGGDNARARRELWWEPRTSVRDGLRAQVSWHLHRARTGAPVGEPLR